MTSVLDIDSTVCTAHQFQIHTEQVHICIILPFQLHYHALVQVNITYINRGQFATFSKSAHVAKY